MRNILIWAGLGTCNGFISGFFFLPFSWQYWVMVFGIFLLTWIIEHKFFDGKF